MKRLISDDTRKMPPLAMLERNEGRMLRMIENAVGDTLRISLDEWNSMRRTLVECRHEIMRLQEEVECKKKT
jgi:hypothetical protein